MTLKYIDSGPFWHAIPRNSFCFGSLNLDERSLSIEAKEDLRLAWRAKMQMLFTNDTILSWYTKTPLELGKHRIDFAFLWTPPRSLPVR